MEKSDSISLYDYRDKLIIVEFSIQEVPIAFGKQIYKTDKYIDLITWLNINVQIDKVIKSIFNNEIDWRTNSKGKIKLDASQSPSKYRITYKIIPKEQTKFNLTKIEYELDWVLTVKIYNDSHSKERRSSSSPPRSSVRGKNTEPTTSSKVQNENQIVTINSSQEMDFEEQIQSAKVHKSTLGRAESHPLHPRSDKNNDNKPKVLTRAQSTLNSKLEDDFTKNGSSTIKLEDSDEIMQDQKRLKVEKCQRLTGTLDTWLNAEKAREMCNDRPSLNITKRKKERKVTPKTPEKSKPQPLELINQEQLEKIENLVEQGRLMDAEKDARKEELKDLELRNCQDYTRAQLREVVQLNKDKILELFAKPHRSRVNPFIDNMRFDSLKINTAGIITDNQMLDVSREVERCRELDDRGTLDNTLHEVVMPYMMVKIFMHKYDMELDDALKRIELQEEKKNLFNLNESL